MLLRLLKRSRLVVSRLAGNKISCRGLMGESNLIEHLAVLHPRCLSRTSAREGWIGKKGGE